MQGGNRLRGQGKDHSVQMQNIKGLTQDFGGKIPKAGSLQGWGSAPARSSQGAGGNLLGSTRGLRCHSPTSYADKRMGLSGSAHSRVFL